MQMAYQIHIVRFFLRNPITRKKTAKVKAKVKHETLDPVWDEQMTLTFTSFTDQLVVDVFDHDKFAKDDFIGRVVIPMNLLENCNSTLCGWFDLTGKKDSQNTQGSIYLHLHAVDAFIHANARKQETFIQQRQLLLSRRDDSRPMKERDAGTTHTISCFLATWNVGNAAPPDDLSAWLPLGNHDLFVIGVQECNYEPRRDNKTCKGDWHEVLVRHFGREYTMLKYHCLWEIRIAIFVVNRHLNKISNVRAYHEATGVANVLGNKGGVVVTMMFNHTSLCFVNSHLAAHQEHTETRNRNVRDIIKHIKVGVSGLSDILSSYHHVFWIGDLNYRLAFGDQGNDKSPSIEQFYAMLAKIESHEYDELYAHDQLRREMREGRVFLGFHEGTYHFPPTFKVARDSTLKYDEERSPAWCDRILWRSVTGYPVSQVMLGCATSIATSDHKPVVSIFQLETFLSPPPIDTTRGDCHLSLRFLQAKNLVPHSIKLKKKKQYTDIIDPFLVFTSPLFKKTVQTPVQKKTLNATWMDLPSYRLTYNNLQRIQKTLIHVRLHNHQLGDHIIGRGIISLTHIPDINKSTTNAPFTCQLTYGGLAAGEIEGVIQLTWDAKLES